MAALQNHRGQPLVDAEWQVLEAGLIVIGSMFGEGMRSRAIRRTSRFSCHCNVQKSMDEMRAMKAIYVYSNHNLCGHKQSAGGTAGDAFSAFSPAGAQQRADERKRSS